ncbi:MAG: HDIG domain-containing protein [Anaerolineaceae bacterium]|nr:MAG: HDIG domain-containing protein [Anaerolineaceae bacterium]
MKTDKELFKASESDSTAVVKQKKLNGTIIYISLLPFLSVLTILLTGLITNTDMLDMIKIGIMVLLVTTGLIFYIRIQDDIFNIRFSKSIILISYLVPILLIMLLINPEVYSFWMIGGLLLAMLVDSKLGLLVYFNHTFILSITFSLRPETIIHLLIMGVLLVLLSGSLKNKSTVIFAAIICLSSNITLSFVMNNFIFESSATVNYLSSFFSIFAVLLIAFLLSIIYDRMGNKDNDASEHTLSQADAEVLRQDSTVSMTSIDDQIEDNQSSSLDRSIRTSYDILLSEDNELLLKIKEYSDALYKHSILIGDLSGRAAKIIGANEALARAGGYYHEAGKINGKNYIEAGLKLADDYYFPEDLKSILRQHNIKHDKPTSIESAIVMISDNVASTIEYIEKSGEGKFTSDKVIDNIFRMRMDKGTFDDSGLSVKDFKLLKEFYQNEYKS